MDHVINYITEYMESDKKAFIAEYQSGKYAKISDCPTYEIVKCYCDALKPLEEYLSEDRTTPQSIINKVNELSKLDNFWRSNQHS